MPALDILCVVCWLIRLNLEKSVYLNIMIFVKKNQVLIFTWVHQPLFLGPDAL